MTRCTTVEPVIRGFVWVHFVGDPEPTKRWLVAYEQCDSTDTTVESDERFTYHHCAKHMRAMKG